MPPPPNERVRSHIAKLFPADERGNVEAILAEECGDNLPLMDDPRLLERIRIAALKVSEGDVGKLNEAVRVAQRDWRDLLVAAGFGEDPLAHERWEPTTS